MVAYYGKLQCCNNVWSKLTQLTFHNSEILPVKILTCKLSHFFLQYWSHIINMLLWIYFFYLRYLSIMDWNMFPQKFLWWSPNPQWDYGERPFKEVIKVKWGHKGRALIKGRPVSFINRERDARDAHREKAAWGHRRRQPHAGQDLTMGKKLIV